MFDPPSLDFKPGDPSEVKLIANGVEIAGWTTVSIHHSMEQIADVWSLEITNQRVGPTGQLQPTGITLDQVAVTADDIDTGTECEIRIGEMTVITGYIDDQQFDYDATRADLRISGRSKAGDLCDCTAIHSTGMWNQATIIDIARDLCKPFGISVEPLVRAIDTAWMKPFTRFRIEPGETVFETLSRAAEMRGVLFTSGHDGSVQIERSAQFFSGATLELGKNVLNGSVSRSVRDRFSDYMFRGQTEASDDWNGIAAAQIKGDVSDEGVGRYRPLMVLSTKQRGREDLGKRAMWERSVRAARSVRHRYGVEGWTSPAGGLWEPNTLVSVKDEWCGVDGLKLITGVDLNLTNERVAVLELMDPAAFDAEPVASDKKAFKVKGRR